jgi:hypothetical protein
VIMAKKKVYEELSIKVEKFKELISKNMKPLTLKDQSSRIQFPMIVLCRKENKEAILKHENAVKEEEVEE